MKGEKTYEKSGFRINYPKKWKTKDVGAGYTAQFFTKRGMFESNLTVVLQDLSEEPSIPTLDKFAEDSVTSIKQFEEDAVDIQVNDRKILNVEGKEIIYAGTSFTSDMYLKHLIVLTLIKKRSIILNFSVEPEYFDDDVKIANEMIDSFELV